jgi:malonate transporter
MITMILSVLPVALIIALGYGLRRSEIVPRNEWKGIESLTFNVFFPAIILATLARADFTSTPVLGLSAVLVLTILIAVALCFLIKWVAADAIKMDNPAFTSVFQGITRWNSFIALAVCANLYGAQGIALMAIAMIAMIPLLNIINIWVLAHYASGGDISFRDVFTKLVTNPIIQACVVGIVLSILPVTYPDVMLRTLDILAGGALVASLLSVGAGLTLSNLRRPGPKLTLTSLIRLIVLPFIAGFLSLLFGLDTLSTAIAVISFGVPTASASYILARKMGGDADLMADIVTLQTILSIITLPLLAALFI